MQQREQPILKKLAEARKAQASAMTRFRQAHARLAQVEARLQAIRARLAASTQPPTPGDTSAHPAPMLFTSSTPQTTGTTPASPPEQVTLRIISDIPTARLTPTRPDPPLQTGESEDEEETKKQPAIFLTRRSTQSMPPVQRHIDEEGTLILPHADLNQEQRHIDEEGTLILARSELDQDQRNIAEEGTLILSHSELGLASETRETIPQDSQDDDQQRQSVEDASSASDITARVPAVRQQSQPPQEPS